MRLSLAGLLLYCPYGKNCPCWIEVLPTAQGERKATTEAFKQVVEKTTSRIVAVFAYREPLPRLQDDGGDGDLSLVLAETMQSCESRSPL